MFESTVSSINQARDALGLKRPVSGQGTFRNVPFLVYKDQIAKGGRRIVKREYPLREDGGAVDLGKKLRERTFSVALVGTDAKTQCDRLTDALDAPGAGELVHPDFGTNSVLVDSWECRSAADELNYYELTITVFPAVSDTAPEVAADTASAVTKQKDSLFGELGNTLSDAWQTVQEATDGATAVLDSITGIFDDMYNAIENIGVLDDVNQLLSALAATKDSAEGLLNAPAMLGANVLGALSGLSNICDASTAFKAYERLGIHLDRRAASIDVSHIGSAAESNVKALFHVATAGTLAAKAAATSGVLTQALDTDNTPNSLNRTPTLSTGSVTGSSVSAPATLSGTGISVNASGSVVSDSDSTVIESDYPMFESAADIERIATRLGGQLDSAGLEAVNAGYVASGAALLQLRLVVVNDLRKRGLELAGVIAVTPAQTEPALVTLYRTTGNCQQWQRLTRRNAIADPLFVPGGISVEVINE